MTYEPPKYNDDKLYFYEAKFFRTTLEYFTSMVNISTYHHPCGGDQV